MAVSGVPSKKDAAIAPYNAATAAKSQMNFIFSDEPSFTFAPIMPQDKQ